MDPGSTTSFLSASKYDDMNLDMFGPGLDKSKHGFKGVGGSTLKARGELYLDFVVDKCDDFSISFTVADIGELDGILGMDFIDRYVHTTDWVSGTLQTSHGTVTMHREQTSTCAHVRLADNVVIPPESQITVPGIVDSSAWKCKSDGILEPITKIMQDKMVVMPRALVSTKNDSVPMTLMNATSNYVTLKGNTSVAMLQKVCYVSESVSDKQVHSFHTVGSVKTGSKAKLPEFMQPLVDEVDPSVTDDQKDIIADKLQHYEPHFFAPGKKVLRTDVVKHYIKTGDHRPTKDPPRRVPIKQREIEKKEVNDMLSDDIIEPSDSAWSSSVVLVKKANGGGIRFCIDYRKLNAVTQKDAYPLPRIDQSLEALSGSAFFCTLDLKSGYWQVEIAEEDRPKTAFVTSQGLYQFKVMPFGLSNAPATFERLMEKVLIRLQWSHCLCYLDDVIVFGPTFQKTLENLELVLERFKKANLMMNTKKCKLFQTSVKFLGHIVSREGISCDPEKIFSVQNWRVPENKTEVLSFLGLASYYRKFIPMFSAVAYPLNNLTKKSVDFVWCDKCESAFIKLKELLTSSPILAYPTEDDPYVLDTDASGFGLGGVLSQIQHGEEKVIAYASKTMNEYQQRYCTTYRELLAVVTFVKQFHHYLYGQEFTLRTDHHALIWLKNFKNPEGMIARWISTLDTYSIIWEHRAGSLHGNADALSRKRRKCKRPDCPDCGIHCQTVAVVQTRRQAKRSQNEHNENPNQSQSQSNQKVKPVPAPRKSKRLAEKPTNAKFSDRGITYVENYRPVPAPRKPKVPVVSESEVPVVSKSEVPVAENHEVPVVENHEVPVVENHEIPVVENHEVPIVETHEVPVHDVVVDNQELSNESVSEVDMPSDTSSTEKRHENAEVSSDSNVEYSRSNDNSWLCPWSDTELKQWQHEDPDIHKVITWLSESPNRPKYKDISAENASVKALWSQWHKLLIVNDILYRKMITEIDNKILVQLVAPHQVRKHILHQLHNIRISGHLGVKRVYHRVRQRFYWPHLRTDVKRWCRKCSKCAQRKPGPGLGHALMQNIPVGRPLEKVAMDIMCPTEVTDRGNRYILVIGDYFSKWAEAYPLPEHTAIQVGDKLVEEFILRYGCPEQIHTDQGREFESELMHRVCDLLDIDKTKTAPYRPQSDGLVERMNRTLIDMIAMYINDHKKDWDDHLPYVTSAYRNSVHESTGFSPNMLMFGREVCTPLDIICDNPDDNESLCPVEYVEWVRNASREAHRVARKNQKSSTKRQKHYYDRKYKGRKFSTGDWVWRYYPPEAKKKFGMKWVGPYLVIKPITDTCYQIQKAPESPKINVHVDHLKAFEGDDPPVSWLHNDQSLGDIPQLDEESDVSESDTE